MSLTTDACKNILAQLQRDYPCPMWEHFLRIIEIPRRSGHHEPIVDHLKAWATEHDFPVKVDAALNVHIAIPATPGLETRPSICLQGHTDIVGVSGEGTDHDFATMPIVPRIDTVRGEEWMMATNTTLGADNGVALAAAMAIAMDPEAVHGPLELLFTSDEEIGLIGANALESGFCESPLLINLDSEESYHITIGCAGRYVNNFHVITDREPCSWATIDVTVQGLVGGHSGADIHTGRANALHLLARVITEAPGDARLVSIDGGMATNAIPAKATARLAVSDEDRQPFMDHLAAAQKTFRAEQLTVDPDIEVIGRPTPSGPLRPALTPASATRLLRFLTLIPHGALRFSHAVEDLVETSYALSMCHTAEDGSEVVLTGSSRSDTQSQQDATYGRLCALCGLAGVPNPARQNEYVGWKPDTSARSLKVAQRVYNEVFPDTQPTAVHAGLECGIIMNKMPAVREAFSVGPDIQDPHSPTEKLMLRSVPLFYGLLKKVLKEMDI